VDWAKGEPNNWDKKEFCVEMKDKKMNDTNCNAKKEFSCRLSKNC